MSRFHAALACVLLVVPAFAQPGAQAPAAPTPRANAPFDPTGYWVSVVTEDWRFRMVTPPKGDVASVPVTAEARRVADAWDPDKDIAAGQQCKSYGVGGIIRQPGRIHITWQDDTTLKLEFDAGTQTRLLHFTGAPSGDPSLQGYSAASWDGVPPAGRGGGRGGAAPAGRGGANVQRPGSLKSITTRVAPGYLRKNGVPYGANATITEYFDRTNEANGDSWLIVQTIIEDPQYLNGQFITSTHFKREADGSKFSPTPCTAK